MRRKRKVYKGFMALLLSAMMVVEPIGATVVHAEEGSETSQTVDTDQTQETGNDEALVDETGNNGDGSAVDPEQGKDGQEKEENRNTEDEDDGSNAEDTDKKDEGTENPGESEEDNEKDTEPGDEENSDNGEAPDVENPDGEEQPDDETSEEEELSEEESEEDPEKAEEDKEKKALGGFEGMPEEYSLSASQMESKRSIAAHIDDVEDYQEGTDYVEGELVTSAESLEEAEMIAKAYNAEILEFSWGILTLKLSKGFSVAQAVRVAADVNLNMPAVWPNYFCYAAGETPVDEGLSVVNGAGIEIEMTEYEADGSSTTVEGDPSLSYMSALTYSDPYLQLTDEHYQYHHEVIGSAYAWAEGYTGSGVKVAVLDTGMQSHDDLPNATALILNMDEFRPAYGNSETLPDVNDITDNSDSGHGTHVAGIIAAKANNGMGVGVAPGVQLFIGKALPNNGGGNIAYAMRGVRAAVAQDVDIINMSLGSPGYSQLFQNIINEAYSEGVAIFAAAGNDSRQDADYPACYNHVISVAATDRNNERASFSNYNKMVDLSAPGVGIWSTSNKNSSGYVSMDGTSMACPVAAGEAAVILSGNNDIYNMTGGQRVDTLEKLMKSNAIKAGSGMGSGITSLPKVFKLSTASTKPGTPKIVIVADNDSEAQQVNVTIEAPQSGMTIYYTTNGKNPAFKDGLPDQKAGTEKYEGAFDIKGSAKATIKAIAVNESGVSSAVRSANFTLRPYVTEIVISGVQEIMKGKAVQLTAMVKPAYASNKQVSWELLDKDGNKITTDVGITISNTGKVTAKKTAVEGIYTIVATAKDKGQQKSEPYAVEVINSFKVDKVVFQEKSVTLTIPTQKSLNLWEKLDTEPVKETDILTAANFKWSSSNTSIAAVSADGEVTALKAGSVTITALANDSSGKKAICKVTIKQLAETINVSGPSVLAAGKSGTFKAEVLPAYTTNKKVTWELWQGAQKVESGNVTINANNGKVTVARGTEASSTPYTVKAIAADDTHAEGSAEFNVASGIINKFSFVNRADSKVTLRRKTTVFATDKQTEADVEVKVEATGTPDWDAYTVTSSNPGIATATGIRKDNIITLTITATGNAAGKTNIVLASTDGSNKKITCAVTVVNPISSIGVAPSAGCNPYVVQGKSLQLKAVVNAEHGTISNKKVDWKLFKEDGTEVVSEDNLGIKISANGKISLDRNAPFINEVIENGKPVYYRKWYTAKAIAKDGSGVYGSCTIYVGQPTTELYICADLNPDWTYRDPIDWENIVLVPSSYKLPGQTGYTYTWGVISDTDLGGFSVSSSNPSVVSVTYTPEKNSMGNYLPDRGYLKYSVLKKGSAVITIKAMDNSGKQVKYKVQVRN